MSKTLKVVKHTRRHATILESAEMTIVTFTFSKDFKYQIYSDTEYHLDNILLICII